MVREIFIVRHAETIANKKGVIQGKRFGYGLSEVGHLQSLNFFNKYKNVEFKKIFISGLKRTHETVHHFRNNKEVIVEVHEALDELDWGIHEGRISKGDIREEYIKVTAEWQNGNFLSKVQGGESIDELKKRLEDFITILFENKETPVLICTH